MNHTSAAVFISLFHLLGPAGAQPTTIPMEYIKQVDAKEELQKLRDKLRGKKKESTGESEQCRINRDMTIELGSETSATQRQVILVNKSGKTASAKLIAVSFILQKENLNVDPKF